MISEFAQLIQLKPLFRKRGLGADSESDNAVLLHVM